MYDLFISYAHNDDKGNPGDDVTRIRMIKQLIEREFQAMTGRPVNIFRDEEAILTGSVWRHVLLKGLQSSRMMLAVLSENYFRSEYCRLEWEHYIDTELDQALPGEGIAPIYVVRYPEFDDGSVDERLRRWVRDLKRRQVDVKWLEWWPEGQSALERQDVADRLRGLAERLNNRLTLYDRREQSPSNQMPQLSRHFKGRLSELHELRANLVKGHMGAITAVGGVPGIGKTELALAYAWGYGGHYPAGRFYLNLAGHFLSDDDALLTLKQKVEDLAPFKGITISDADRKSSGAAFAKVCQAFISQPDQPALFIVDNVDDPRLLRPSFLAQGLPQGPHIDVILTTRHQELAQDRLAWLSVDALEIEDGVRVLESFVPIHDSPQDVDWKAAYAIAERLGGHALALNIVGVYMRWKKESYPRTLKFLIDNGLELVSVMGRDVQAQNIDLGSAYKEQVLDRLLAPTLDNLQVEQPAAYRALELAAFCPPDNVPLPWLVVLLSFENPDWGKDQMGGSLAQQAVDLVKGLRILVPIQRQRAGLVAETVADGPLARTHRVYMDAMLRRMTTQERDSTRSILRGVVEVRSVHLRDNWGSPDLLWEVWPLLDLVNLVFVDDERDSLLLLDRLAFILRHVGRLADVERLTRRQVAIVQRLYDSAPENAHYARDLSVSMSKMGDLFRSLGDGKQAREYYEKALEVSQRLHDSTPENADYARDLSVSMSRMGDLFRSLGDGKQAREYYEKALEVSQRLHDSAPENAEYARDLSVSMNKMGELFRSLGDGKQAREYYEKALEVSQRLHDSAPENAEYARDLSVSFERMGELFRSLGDGKQAREYYEKDLEVSQRLHDSAPENAEYARDLSVSMNKMGDLFRSLGDGKQAREYYEKALEVSQRLHDSAPENADYARDLSVSMNKMGDLFSSLGDGKQAREYYEKALEVRQRLHDSAPENAEYARDLSVSFERMGELFRSLGDGKQAREYYEKDLEVSQRLHDSAPENAEYARDLSVSMNKMGDLFRSLGDGKQAREYYEKALEVSQRLHDSAPENADYARDLSVSMNKMGDLFSSLGDGKQAREYYEKALEVRQRLHDSAPENADYARDLSVSMSRMGDLFSSLGDGKQAREYYEKALEVRQRLHDSAPENAEYARDLGVSHDKMVTFFSQIEDGQAAVEHLIAFLRIMLALAQRGALPNPEDQKILMSRLEIAQKLGLIPSPDPPVDE